jgi:hypothetical protein
LGHNVAIEAVDESMTDELFERVGPAASGRWARTT